MGSSQRNVNLQNRKTNVCRPPGNRIDSRFAPRKLVCEENPMDTFLKGYKPKAKKKRHK